MVVVFAVVMIVYLQKSPTDTNNVASEASTSISGADSASEREVVLETQSEPVTLMDLSGAGVGESFSLYIPQEDRILQGTVQRLSFSKAGNRVLQGRIRDGDQAHSFVITVGQYQTFGSIQTSRDRYQFELTDGEGTLIAQSTLNEKRDYSQPDFVIPERKEPANVDEN